MSEDGEIDLVDYSLLAAVQQMDVVPWKKKVYEWVTAHSDQLPGIDSISLQTVSRRMDALQEAGLLESCITRPSEVKRDLIIGFSVTDCGAAAVQEKREEMLQQQMYAMEDSAVDTAVLVELLMEEFELADASRELLEEFDDHELVTLFAVFYAQSHIDRLLREGSRATFTALLEQDPQLADSFSNLLERAAEPSSP